MATHNGEKFIKKQIESILRQLDKNDELIISDDGSSDETINIINSYNDKRIKVLNYVQDMNISRKKHSRNFYYATRNFENALKNANGDYIFLSDQDDIWTPNRVEVFKRYLQKYDCVMCNLSIIDSNDKVIEEKYFHNDPVPRQLIKYILKTRILGCCIAFNRQLLNFALPFPKDLMSHDYWIGSIAIKKFSFYFIDDVLHLYRRTGNNVSTTYGKSKNSLVYKIMYRIEFYLQLRKFLKNKKRGIL